ncbi:Rho GTPase-activating protein [Rhodosporidiobolus nylandii]
MMSPRQSGDGEEEQERLSGSTSPGPQGREHPSYFPGPPTRNQRDEREPAQYPLPSSRQQSIDSSPGDLPGFSSPFPPPPPPHSNLAAPQTQSRSHLAPSPSNSNLSQLQKVQSTSSLLSASSAGGSYSYEAASPAGEARPYAGVEPSPDPSNDSSQYDVGPAGNGDLPTPAGSQGDFAQSGEGLGLGRAVLEQAHQEGLATRRPSLTATAAGGGSYDAFSVAPAGMAGAEVQEDAVPTGFDEGVLRALCDMDCGMPLLLERMKQSMTSCREASAFLKKRAQIEEEYARAMSKLAKSSMEQYSIGDGKAGSYVSSWLSLLKTHELLGDNRLKFATQLAEMGDELNVLGKEVDKTRKATKELGTRLERGLQEQENLVDKARGRFDSAAEELERLLLLKQGEAVTPSSVPHSSASSSTNPSKGRSFGKAMSKLKGPKNPAQVAKLEEEVRSRMGQSSDAYRAQVTGAQAVRQEYFNMQLPRILRSLKESVDELDLGTQYHLSRYAYLFESLLVTDGLTISPVSVEDGPGIKSVVDAVDVRDDFKTFMQQFALTWQMSGQRGPRREGPADEGFPSRPALSPRASHSNLSSLNSAFSPSAPPATPRRPTFGVDLGEQMSRDGVEVPRVLEKCAEAIELHGLDSMGIYRLSGTTSRVQRLKAALDRDVEGTDLLSEENLTDINDIAAVCKLWFRELPEPLLTWELYHQFIDVSKIENDRLRHIRLHERVNELPDPNYATLKFLMGHLDKIAQHESQNQMSVSNLAIVFGPNLLGAPPPHLAAHYPPPPSAGDGEAASSASGSLADMQWQSRCIETILRHYQEIFVE